MRRQYGRLGSFVTVCEDLRDIGRRLDALDAGRRSDNDLPDDESQKKHGKAGREVGWYPVWMPPDKTPVCMFWNGHAWGLWPGARFVTVGPLDWIGPRLDLPEER